MPPSAQLYWANVERVAASDAPDRVEPAVQRLVAEVPLRSRVLEIGCGNGALARELASKRGARITAIDLAPRLIDLARVRTRDSLGIDYRVADFMELSPRGFDVAVAIDTLCDLPLALAASRMASAVVPGGLVVIADGFATRRVLDAPYDLASVLLGYPRRDVPMTLREVRSSLRASLPGVVVRRHLGWRYVAIWKKPAVRP